MAQNVLFKYGNTAIIGAEAKQLGKVCMDYQAKQISLDTDASTRVILNPLLSTLADVEAATQAGYGTDALASKAIYDTLNGKLTWIAAITTNLEAVVWNSALTYGLSGFALINRGTHQFHVSALITSLTSIVLDTTVLFTLPSKYKYYGPYPMSMAWQSASSASVVAKPVVLWQDTTGQIFLHSDKDPSATSLLIDGYIDYYE